jgi:hypothetical protein
MARCGCISECNCVVRAALTNNVNLSGLSVTGSGSPASPYEVRIVLDPDVANAASLSADGLMVTGGAGSGAEIDNTYSISVAGDGSIGTPYALSVDLDLPVSGASTNMSSISANGLKSVVSHSDSTSAALTGNGTPLTPLQAAVKLDAAATNIISTTANGLYATSVGEKIWNLRTVNNAINGNFGDLVITTGATTYGINLPNPVGNAGKAICVKKTDAAGTIYIYAVNGETIDGVSGNISATVQWSSITLVSSGAVWYKIAGTGFAP